MEHHEKFTEWAIGKGVKINGIRPHRFEGRGLGIIAEKDLKVRGHTSLYFLVLPQLQITLGSKRNIPVLLKYFFRPMALFFASSLHCCLV